MSMKSNTGKNMYADTSDESTSDIVIVRWMSQPRKKEQGMYTITSS